MASSNDDILVRESSVSEYLQSMVEIGNELPELESSTKLLTALSKCSPEGGELKSGLRVADEARTSLIAALKRETREGGNPGLGAESAANVGEASEALANAVTTLMKSFQAAEAARIQYKGDIEVSWRTASLAARVQRKSASTYSYTFKKKTESAKQKRLCAVLAFDANMARATSGFARMLTAGRMLKQQSEDPVLQIKGASNELRRAAGAWQCIDDAKLESLCAELFDGSPPPPELSSVISCALRELCLAAADRLALLTLFKKESSPPTTLAARLASGIAEREQRATDFFRTYTSSLSEKKQQLIVVKPHLAAITTLSQSIVAGLAEGLWARSLLAASPELTGRAVGCCRRGLAIITKAVAQVDRRSPIFKAALLDTAKNLATAIGRRLDVYERDNNTIYFQAVPAEPAAGRETPLNLAKPIMPDIDSSTVYELAPVLEESKKAEEPIEAPPTYDEVTPPSHQASPATLPTSDYDAIRVTLPVGYAPGDRLIVEGPDKTRLETIVPSGARPGDLIEVNRSGAALAPGRAPPPLHSTSHMPIVASAPAPPPSFADLSISSPPSSTPTFPVVVQSTYQPEAPPPSYSSSYARTTQEEAKPAFITCPRCTFNNKPTATQCEICESKL